MSTSADKGSHKIFILGPGRVGLSLGLLFHRAGLDVIGIWGRRKSSLSGERESAMLFFHGPFPPEMAVSNVILITTVDRAIEEVAGRLADCEHLPDSAIVYHCSGAFDSGILASLKAKGISTGTIHPLQSIPTAEVGTRLLPGSYFTLEGDGRAVRTGRALVKAIGGYPLPLAGGDRGLYHAAAAMAGNFLVTLVWSAARMVSDAGLKEERALQALQPMIRGVVSNIEEIGIRNALTGPVSRGDAHTLRIQLEAIGKKRPEDLPLFVAMAERTIELSREIGLLDEERIRKLRKVIDAFDGRT